MPLGALPKKVNPILSDWRTYIGTSLFRSVSDAGKLSKPSGFPVFLRHMAIGSLACFATYQHGRFPPCGNSE